MRGGCLRLLGRARPPRRSARYESPSPATPHPDRRRAFGSRAADVEVRPPQRSTALPSRRNRRHTAQSALAAETSSLPDVSPEPRAKAVLRALSVHGGDVWRSHVAHRGRDVSAFRTLPLSRPARKRARHPLPPGERAGRACLTKHPHPHTPSNAAAWRGCPRSSHHLTSASSRPCVTHTSCGETSRIVRRARPSRSDRR